MSRSPLPGRNQPSSKKSKSSAVGYSGHRERQRLRILSAAESLFVASGIDRVTILGISAESGIRPSTVYQYFGNKEDVVWAVTSTVREEARDRAQPRLTHAQTGLDKVATLLDLMAEDLEQRPERVRFMAQFDALYASDLPTERLLSIERQLGMNNFDDLIRWTEQGIADGSMNPGLDPKVTMHAVLNAATGTQRRLASLGVKVEREYGQPISSLFREAMRVIVAGLRAEPIPRQTRATPKRAITPSRRKRQ